MQWKPCELHTHTNHSDGQHTLMEMAKEAAKLGLSSLALTDHNTMSGLIDQEIVEAETEVSVVIDVQDVIWLRAELYGVLNEVRTMIAFTNPIYLTVTGENFS